MGEVACTKSEIDVFQGVDVQVSMTDGRWQQYYPLNSITNAQVLDFTIPGSSNDVIDMERISLYVRGKITNAAGANLIATAATTPKPVNNVLNSLFTDVDVSLNGQLITRSSRDYAYKDYLKRLLFTDMPPSSDGQFQQRCVGWYMDQAGNMDAGANTGSTARAAWIGASRTFEFMGKPGVDLFACERVLHPGTDLSLKFYLAEPKFFMTEIVAAAAGNAAAAALVMAKLELEEVLLYVRRVNITDTAANDITRQLSNGMEALYPYTRTETTVVGLSTGTTVFNKENLFQGKLAIRYTICFVTAAGYAGSYTAAPYKFDHVNLKELGLYENGQPIGGTVYKVNFTDSARTIECYHRLLECIGAVGDRAITPALDYDHFVNESTVFCFSRSPDLVHGEYHSAQRNANLTLKLMMSAATTVPYMMICMAEYDSLVKIDKDKNVVTDFAV